jgi:catalase
MTTKRIVIDDAPVRHKKTVEPRGSSSASVNSASARSPALAEVARVKHTNAHALAEQQTGLDEMVARVPTNSHKQYEYGMGHALAPVAGIMVAPTSDSVTASTVSEMVSDEKLGQGTPNSGASPLSGSLDRARSDASGQVLTTNMGLGIGDNQSSLKAGLRGPTLLEDFILREKITHFDHERIPERIVHARGSGAHGFFECYESLTDVTMAAPLATAGKRTPVFVRFSTVAGERGSADAVRDARGFAVKFYTEAGNWDIVGNNMPVFFIQDAMKFPDFVHAVKPEPHHGMPQAASAHDTFWDFVSLMPESTHMLLWVMSDRAIPRSYATMQGFGVHTFRLVNEAGESVFCKFHWNPKAGTHSLVWDEAVKINGADSDFHRRDLWESIETGNFPEWELGLQIFTEQQAEAFSFDVLDATKLIPEELIPVRPVGRMILNRNPDNFFAETEQVAFGTANVIPGIDFSNDPLLAGRHHSYLDTQLSRLGGPNFHEIPINSPVAKVHNNQRDGIHRQTIPRGRVAYEPNSLGGGCPFQAGLRGYATFPSAVHEDKVRGKPEKFADHYTQATLFWNSQSKTEQQHIVDAFRFELSKVKVRPIRERVLSMLVNVDNTLANRVAAGLGFAVPPAQAILYAPKRSEVAQSAPLSLLARPGDGSIAGMCVALIVTEDSNARDVHTVYGVLKGLHAMPSIISSRLCEIVTHGGGAETALEVETTFEISPSVLWDACVVFGTAGRDSAFINNGEVLEFLDQQYHHSKPIITLGDSDILDAAKVSLHLPGGDPDNGVVVMETLDIDILCAVLSKRRYFERERLANKYSDEPPAGSDAKPHAETRAKKKPTVSGRVK